MGLLSLKLRNSGAFHVRINRTLAPGEPGGIRQSCPYMASTGPKGVPETERAFKGVTAVIGPAAGRMVHWQWTAVHCQWTISET
jgi:hypothetical protein